MIDPLIGRSIRIYYLPGMHPVLFSTNQNTLCYELLGFLKGKYKRDFFYLICHSAVMYSTLVAEQNGTHGNNLLVLWMLPLSLQLK